MTHIVEEDGKYRFDCEDVELSGVDSAILQRQSVRTRSVRKSYLKPNLDGQTMVSDASLGRLQDSPT